MAKEPARRHAGRIVTELDSTIRNYSSLSIGLDRIIELGRDLRDAVFDSQGTEIVDRERIFELFRNAKLLALAHADAQHYIERIEMLEDDLRRVG